MEKAYKKYQIRGVIIGGDFNTNQEGSEWKEEKTIPTLETAGFWNCWSGVKAEDRLSWKGTQRFPATTFDFFFTKGLGKVTANLATPSEDASDHRPVVFKLNVP
jgi:endonuclease/exonuclease/phosphatase family metal-dependent hydrolase